MKSNIKPLVSILTPAWNRSAYLEKVWAGLDSQVYSEIEWIIANDGSTDDTAKVCLELQSKSRFPVTIIEANLHVGKPRMDNELIKAAKGDFLIWCDSDDYLLPGAIERLVSVWESMPATDQASYIGLTALCATEEGVLQSTPSSRLGIFDTTWSELDDIYQAKGDKLFFVKAEKIKNSRFVEGDFMVTEGSMWLNFFEMKTKYIPEIMKIMDRGASNRISFSGKMEYCRGKAYGLAICEKIKPTVQGFNIEFIWKLIKPLMPVFTWLAKVAIRGIGQAFKLVINAITIAVNLITKFIQAIKGVWNAITGEGTWSDAFAGIGDALYDVLMATPRLLGSALEGIWNIFAEALAPAWEWI